jgi:hypothetical protein
VVGGVEEQVLRGGEVEGAEREVVALTGELVEVEHDLLAGHRRSVGEVGGRLERGPAQDGVLLALLGAVVEPSPTLAVRHREVGLLDPGLDLGEQLGLEGVGAGEGLRDMVVLRPEQGEHLGIGPVVAAQPEPVVHPLVPVGDQDVGAAFGLRRRGGHGERA